MSVEYVDGRWGRTYYIKKDEYVGKSIWNYGEYNPDETETILSLVPDSGLILDIGANFGVIAQALEASGYRDRTIAFEPQQYIVKNVLSKNFTGRIVAAAVGSECGELFMPRVDYDKPNNFGGFGIVNAFTKNNNLVTVPVITIDSLKLDKVGLMKIDVEGFEENVLRGARETILRDKPVIYMEADRQDKVASLLGYITSLGYSYNWHQPPLFRENNFFGKKKNIWDKNYVSVNVLCKPLA
jgi:FkbM family methyltransferase